MTTRSLPNIFTPFSQSEVSNYKLAKGSLARKFAQQQNYLYAQLRRTYSNWAYEGDGARLFWLENVPQKYLSETPENNGSSGLLISDFLVPQPWAGGTILKVQGRLHLATGTVGSGGYTTTSTAYILVQLVKEDETPVGPCLKTTVWTTTGDHDWSVNIKIPRSGEFRCQVWMVYNQAAITGGAGSSNHSSGIFYLLGDYAELIFVSARMDPTSDDTVDGAMLTNTWTPLPDLMASDYYPLSSVLMTKLAQNINHLYAYRGPELCQTYFAKWYNNTNAFTEVGRYVVYLPNRVTEITGKLYVQMTHSGAGNEVRVLVDGVVKQTFTALTGTYGPGSSQKDLDVSAITGLASNAEHTITIEAKSTAASADWGTVVNGVYFWESSTTLGLPSGTTVPTDYQPLDEDGLSGDADIEGHKTDLFSRRTGITALLQNDRWLAANRLRGLVGHWRHRSLKRGQPFVSHVEDARVDWTRGQESFDENGSYQGDPGRNITLMGSPGSSADEESDGYASFANDGQWVSDTGYNAVAPYTYPTGMVFTAAGLRLAQVPIKRPPSVNSLMKQLGYSRTKIRGARHRPYQMTADSNGEGPLSEEAPYIDQGLFQLQWDSGGGLNPVGHIKCVASGPYIDSHHHWCGDFYTLWAGADTEIRVVGYLYNIPSTPSKTGANSAIRPSGMLFEMEMNGLFIADEALDAVNIGGLA